MTASRVSEPQKIRPALTHWPVIQFHSRNEGKGNPRRVVVRWSEIREEEEAEEAAAVVVKEEQNQKDRVLS